jgi:diaminohydroxyphosphoribosylaminopyrimidine deaminase / 5-amino-6-(5-phosphoribosylamino)uracil reductase
MTTTSTHHDYMSSALNLALHGRYTVSPNPMVGCIIVKNHRVIGQGWHQRAGGAHAEIHALKEAGSESQGAIVYLTLEPCCHYGRTPPCTQALIQAGIKKVYVACLDANPLVAGKGVQALRSAGIEVETGLCETAARQMNEIFFHYIQHKRPFVMAKWAMSLDGKTITHPHDAKDISCRESRYASHAIRQQVDAILVGSKTAIDDDPLLTVRHHAADDAKSKQPIRIILASRGQLPLHLTMFDPSLPAHTIIATTDEADKDWCDAIRNKNIEVLFIAKNKQGQVDLPTLLDELGKKEITSLLVEGGMTVHQSFFNENLVNQIHVYLAPVIIGSLNNKKIVTNINLSRIDSDFYFTAILLHQEHHQELHYV